MTSEWGDGKMVVEVPTMPNAVLQNGEIRPLEPLPPNWREGQRLRIEAGDDDTPNADDIDRDFAQLEALCADSEPADEEQLRRALGQIRQQSKEQVRRQMGLP
jgi:hypothetical protein